MKILFVCTGNTCRSPMAEGLAKALGQAQGLNLVTSSAGLFAAYGAKVSPEAVEAVKDLADISGHESRPLTVEAVTSSDWIIAMTEEHKRVLLRQFPGESAKIKTLSEWAGHSGDVVDPYGGSQDVYNQCAQEIKALLVEGLEGLTV